MKTLLIVLGCSLLSVSFLGLPPAHAVEIVIPTSENGSEDPDAPWIFQGDIEKGDFDKFISVIRKTKKIPSSIALDSTGGDINEAINLGHFFRKALIGYQGVEDHNGIPKRSECSSACALIYFGAVNKSTTIESRTRIGLHRPYFDRDYVLRLTESQASDQYQRAEKTIREYLQEMHVPVAVADIMFETEATSMSYFNDHELSEWLPQTPDYELWLGASCESLTDGERIALKESRENSGAYSTEHTSYLESRYAEFLRCKHRLVSKTHESVLRGLGCSVAEGRISC